MTIASLPQRRNTITQIAQRLKRSARTISRELERNAQDGCYARHAAATCVCQRRRSGRSDKKLHAEGILFGVAHHFLNQRWSPEQIALTLASICPKGHVLRVSTETIYNCIYAQPVGQLKKDLIQALRLARNKRVPRSKGQDRRGQILEMLSTHLRPPHIEDRLLPGHWEGDLIKGAANASAVGALVERTSRVVMLVKLPESKPASAANVLRGFTDKLLSIAQSMRHSMTYDQSREMVLHKELSQNTGIAVYFCDPHSPWQRGSNENMNRLIRQYLQKGTDLSVYSQAQLDATADQINNRPRKGFGGTIPHGGVHRTAAQQPTTYNAHTLANAAMHFTSLLNPPSIMKIMAMS